MAVNLADQDYAIEVPAAHAVFDGNIALVTFAIDFGSAVLLFNLAELSKGHPLAGGRQQPDALDGLLGISILRQVAHHQGVRASPCKTCVSAFPPTAVLMASCTSATLIW